MVNRAEVAPCDVDGESQKPHQEVKKEFINRIANKDFESPQEAADEFKMLLAKEPKDSTEFIEETYEALFLSKSEKEAGKISLAKCFGAGMLVGAGKFVAAAVLNGLFKNVEK